MSSPLEVRSRVLLRLGELAMLPSPEAEDRMTLLRFALTKVETAGGGGGGGRG